jgi:glycine betaine/proline transport system substrate-binding protein
MEIKIMTSKHIKRFLSMIAVMFISISNVHADEIKIAELNWQSGSMIANIDAYILTHGYGHDVEIIPGGIDATIQSMMATGSPNIFGEAWTSLLGDSAHEYINNGSLIQVRDEVIVGAGESWYIPSYIREQYELITIEEVIARPDLFPHPEDSSKGGIVICPEGWSCKKHNENLFRAFNMEAKGWRIIDPGSGTGLNAYWEGAVVKGQSAFGYYWTPTVLVGRLGLVSLQSELGFTGDDNWTNCISIAVEECANPQPTSFPVAKTGTIITLGLDSAVVDYVTARGFDGSVITSMLVWSDDNQATAEEAAVEFITRHPEIWTEWVTPEAATRITASLN